MQIPEYQNIFKDKDGKWWIESGDQLDETDQTVPNDYHGLFLTLQDAEEYLNENFDYPTSYFVDPTGVRHHPFHKYVNDGSDQDRTGSKEVINKVKKPVDGAPVIKKVETEVESLEPKIYYIQDGQTLYSLKPNEYRSVLQDRGNIEQYKTVKHLPTCITRRGDALFSSDPRRPLYRFVGDKLVR